MWSSHSHFIGFSHNINVTAFILWFAVQLTENNDWNTDCCSNQSYFNWISTSRFLLIILISSSIDHSKESISKFFYQLLISKIDHFFWSSMSNNLFWGLVLRLWSSLKIICRLILLFFLHFWENFNKWLFLMKWLKVVKQL